MLASAADAVIVLRREASSVLLRLVTCWLMAAVGPQSMPLNRAGPAAADP